MTPQFAFSTWQDAARKLNAAASAADVNILRPLPYRRFDQDAVATWWLTPSKDNPAYADGKIVVERPSPFAPDGPLIGLHIEKGIGPTAAELFSRRPSLVMNDGWIWRAFFRDMSNGRVERDMLAAEAAADGLPLVVAIVTAIEDLPGLEQDEHRERDRGETVWYTAVGGRLERAGQHDPSVLTRSLDMSETLPSLAQKIAALKDLDWRWVEILLGIPFEHVEVGGMPASEVWARACAPWRSWLR
jgi:hypothetical protein